VIDGLLVIDKPAGITSHDVVQKVRRWAGQRRVGHLGTLDPLATGVLPLALGEATKLSQLLTHGKKSYSGRICLGVETDTYDREGTVLSRYEGPWPGRDALEKALDTFRGEIQQVPPPFSARKQDGQKAYQMARRGETVELEPRTVTIERLDLGEYQPPLLAVDVDCSAGTYLRSLAHDLGTRLGVGGHLWELCRTRSGPFTLEQAVALQDLAVLGEDRVIPMAAATGLPSYQVDPSVARRVSCGMRLARNEIRGAPAEGPLQLICRGRMVALMEAQPGIPELRTVRVFLEGTKS
jgi:tRNA pseudouridine55 synthase